jgi:hypothetical protein
MRVSIGWIALFLLVTMCVLSVLLPFRHIQTVVQEGFSTAADIVSGERLDIELLTCPVDSEAFVEKATGKSFCCNGTIQDERCNGKLLCTTSHTTKNSVPSCSQYKYSLFEEKAANRCPASLPKYWETPGKGQKKKGCCEKGGRAKDGNLSVRSQIHGGPPKMCILYPTLEEEKHYANSCYNTKRMEEEQCFSKPVPSSFNVSKTLVEQNGYMTPAQIICRYYEPREPRSVAQTCTTLHSGELLYENSSLKDTWKDDPSIASNYCDAQYTVHVLKQYPPLPPNYPAPPSNLSAAQKQWRLNWSQKCLALSVPSWTYN